MLPEWNTDSRVSVQAELIGRQWVNIAHQLRVFSFLRSNFSAAAIADEDKGHGTRCFNSSRIAQNLRILPKDELAKVFHHIRKKAVTVIHDKDPPRILPFINSIGRRRNRYLTAYPAP